MKMISWFAILSAIALVNSQQQAVFQQAGYPLTGFLHPLTFPVQQSASNFQQPQTLTSQRLIIQQQPAQASQQQQQQQQQAIVGNTQQQQPLQQLQQTSISSFQQQQQQPSISSFQQQQQPSISSFQQQQPSISGFQQQPSISSFQPQQTSTATLQQQQQPIYEGPSAVVNNVRADGTYAFGYQTPDGQMRAESVQADGTTRGSYTYRTPEGQLVTINYTAGRNGFQTTQGSQITSTVDTVGTAQPAQTVQTAQTAQTVQNTLNQQTAQAPAPANQQSYVQVSETGSAGTPLIIYSTVPVSQTSFPSYYPFGPLAGQPVAAAVEQQTSTGQQVQSSNTAVQGQDTAGTASGTNAASTSVGNPAGFSYGSNPQAIQQLQRLLLV